MRRLTLTIAVACAAALAAPAGAGAATRCRSGRANVHVGRAHVCIAIHGSPAADQLRLGALAVHSLDRGIRLRPRGHHHPPSRPPAWTRSRGLSRALNRGLQLAAGMGSGAPIIAGARAASDESLQPVHEVKPIDQNGWKGQAELDFVPMSGSETQAADFGFEERKTVRVHKGAATEVVQQVERIAIDQCPEVSGRVPGTYTWTVSDRQSGPSGDGGTYRRIYSETANVRITGHTTDDGHIRDYDLDMHFLSNRQAAERDGGGSVVAADPPQVYALDFSRHGLHLLSYEDFTQGRHDPAFGEILAGGFDVGTANGPGGSFLSGVKADRFTPEQADQFEIATMRFSLAQLRASGLLTTLQGAWVDGNACLKVSVSSSDVQLPHQKDLNGNDQPDSYTATMHAGQQGHFTATVSRRQGGELAPGTYAISLTRSGGTDKGTVAPAGGSFGSAALPFAYTAPTQDWTPRAYNTVFVYVSVHSHQGHGSAAIYVSPAAARYALVYRHASTAGYSYPYGPEGTFQDQGTYAEQRDVALAATVPLTLDATKTKGTGTGTLGWQRSSWVTDDDDTARSGQSFSTWCDIEYHDQVTGTTPGTLQVKSLTLGAPGAGGRPTVKGLDVLLSGVAERWHMDETQKSGPCPAFDGDSTEQIFLNQFFNFHDEEGDAVGYAYGSGGSEPPVELQADGGWVPGSGDVIAQRTFSGTYADGAHSGAPASAVVHWTDTFQLVQVPG